MTEVVVLAGGLGTRLRSEVPDLPKPMAPVAGRPFLEILLERWVSLGATHFVLSVGYRHEAIQSHFGRRFRGAEIDYAVETSALGTGGGLLLAAQKLRGREPYVVANGDTYLEVELRALADFHAACGADVTVALVRQSDTGRYAGVATDPGGRIRAFGTAEASQINGGVYLFSTGTLEKAGFAAGQRMSLETDLLPRLLAMDARVCGFRCDGRFIDIGIPEDFRRASDFLGN
jgi:D-glycero-alpha-D-manno-heptose 1-phosphate guanylyltransferase